MQIKLSDIDLEQSVQVRASIDQETVERYAEHTQTPKSLPLPPVVVFGLGNGRYFLADGWHRVFAAKKAGRTHIAATVKDGDWKAALEHALGSNTAHGLPRTNRDKRRVVELAIKHWNDWSDQLVGNKCGVSREFVCRCRNELQPVIRSQVDSEEDTETGGKSSDPSETQAATGDNPKTILGKDGKRRKRKSRPPVQRLENSPGIPPTTGTEELPADQLGRTVPPHLVALWERRREVSAQLNQLSKVQRALEQAKDDRDPLWYGAGQGQTPVNFSTAIAHIKQARATISEALPWAVCPMCQGAGCRCCSGNGLISKFRYDTIVPANMKGRTS